MKDKTHRPLIITVSILIIINLAIYGHVKYKSDFVKVRTATQGMLPGENSEDVYLTVQRGKDWPESLFMHGVQYDFVIHNNSNLNISNWELTIPLPKDSILKDSWNMEYEEKDGLLYVKGVDYNETINAHTTQPLGIILHEPEIVDIFGCKMQYYPVQSYKTDYIFWLNVAFSIILCTVIITYARAAIKINRLKHQNEKTKELTIQTMNTFSNFVDAKDPYTKGHSARVATYSVALAQKLKLPKEDIEAIKYIGLMHDIGKIAIPDSILNKPGKLTEDERKTIETHPVKGAEMLKDFSAIDGMLDAVKHHHERYDGKGYPDKLNGEDIPYIARIICVTDSYDAMNSDRCYRKKLDAETIKAELKNNSGKQFDPLIVKAMLELLEEKSVK